MLSLAGAVGSQGSHLSDLLSHPLPLFTELSSKSLLRAITLGKEAGSLCRGTERGSWHSALGIHSGWKRTALLLCQQLLSFPTAGLADQGAHMRITNAAPMLDARGRPQGTAKPAAAHRAGLPGRLRAETRADHRHSWGRPFPCHLRFSIRQRTKTKPTQHTASPPVTRLINLSEFTANQPESPDAGNVIKKPAQRPDARRGSVTDSRL